MARPRLILRAYVAGDIERFTPRSDFAIEKAAVAWAWKDGPPPGRSWTLWEMGRQIPLRVLGVGGVFDHGEDGQAWAILAELSPRQWYAAGQLAQQALDGVQRFGRRRRITATARTSIRGAVFMLEKLGFEPIRKFTDPRIGPDVIYQHMVRAA